MLPLIALFAGMALLWAWLEWRKTSRYWAERGVPHNKPHPVYGSLNFLQRENPAVFMRNLYDQIKAPYAGIWLFWRPALVINSPEIARRVLIKDADRFRNRLAGTGLAKTDAVGGLNLFTVNDPLWSSTRRVLTPVFTSAKLRALHDLKSSKSKELLKRIGNDLKENKKIEIRTLFADFTTDVIGAAAFGVGCDTTLSGASPMRTVTKDFMQYGVHRGLAWVSIFFLPEVANFFKFSMFPKRSIAYFRKVYQMILAQRGSYDPHAPDRDLMDALIKMKHEAAGKNEELDDDLVLAQAAVFLQAGFDTTAVSLSFLTYELAFYPETQEKLYKELVDAKEKLGDKEFDSSVLSKLPYMNAVIKETLRKYPPMGWLDRVADRPYQIDESLTIPAGMPVYVNSNGLHFDPQYYPDPEEFIPERFLGGNEKDASLFTYMPFGEGPRSCIGKRFAYQVMWYAMATIFMKYQVRPKPGAKRPSEIELEKRAMFLMPGEDLIVDFVPRN